MKKLITLSILFLTFTTNAQNFQKNFIDQNYIELTGTSRLELTPNEIYLKISINENNKNGKLSVEEQEELMVKTLTNIPITLDNNFKIIDYTSNFRYFFLKKTDIRKSKTYQLKLANGLEVGKVYLALENIGISNISIEKIDHNELEKFKLETKIKAIKMAKTKAEKYTEAIGQNLGKAIYIQEVENYNPTTYNNNIQIRGASSYNSISKFESKSFENIEFENIVINAKVLVKFKLE
ncbi:SIMPL domain-containing protein [Lutibacter sp. TH_r2]|uniref:SIMPL domain-containing protein n=1 Tax=Lutibacter sp. TH_r2 TaxID=3082083 RepID=UPI002955853C|nr:SIMPL domain-containing protein [Lutibacter sp. TH_r2]MDV7187888.1 SIMPL domain-containing protein [Lutibacter sp. TH_r2]